ncbi:MAG: hypothetical protein K1X94_11365 [Sandaracinaceae bacterium]|nr:hypothetical protein [Sandaracinaceae bacterium]
MTTPPSPSSSIHRRAFVVGGASLLATLAACGKPTPGEIVVFTASSPELAMASVDPETGSWQSAPWGDTAGTVTWLPYPPRGQIQIEHGLGRVPSTVLVYLSFDEHGSSPALAAGDLARVLEVDATTVTLWNATNGSYFARVVVQ